MSAAPARVQPRSLPYCLDKRVYASATIDHRGLLVDVQPGDGVCPRIHL